MSDTNRRIHVAHIALQVDVGGAEKLLVEFARHVDRSRFTLEFISMTNRGPVADEIAALGWPVVCMNAPPRLQPSLVLRLAERLRASGTRIIHAHNIKPLLYSVPAARFAGKPSIVYTRHGQWKGDSFRRRLSYRMATKFVGAVVCVSRDAAELSLKQNVPAERLKFIPNGIDTDRFRFAGPAPQGPAVMVGRLSPEKDVAALVSAAAIVVKQDPEFRLEIAGDGPCREALEAQVAKLGLQNVVRFLGSVSDVPSLLTRASMFVLSSLTEGMSLAILEAMATGLPVVATRVGGNPEVVVEGETGLLVPPSDAAALAAAILDVRMISEVARQMGTAGAARVRRHFDVRQMIGQYQAIYSGLALGPCSSSSE